MENSLRYQVRSREIVDLVSAMRSGRLTLSAYFQRNLVWRDTHKHDFIDTILKGFPFPQVFLARGPINVDTMESSTCVVDGQQRLNAIKDFVDDGFPVNGRCFSELSLKEKEEFLKYEVAVIDFDLDAGDENLKEVFKRLNRTFYSLSTIERIATEYSASQFMLIARVLSGDVSRNPSPIEIELSEDFDSDHLANNNPNGFLRDPGIPTETWVWLRERTEGEYSKLISGEKVFSHYEAQRKVPLMFVLNVMSTFLGGYYNRNLKVKEYLETYNSEFEQSDIILNKFNSVGSYIQKMNLPENSIWWNKANFFTLTVELMFSLDKLAAPEIVAKALTNFEAQLPNQYALAAREGVNNRPQRIERGEYFRATVGLGQT